MTVRLIHFVQQVPVPRTSLRLDQFDADSGWVIDIVDGLTVKLARPADLLRRLTNIPEFLVVGVPYSAPLDDAAAVNAAGIGETPIVLAKARKR